MKKLVFFKSFITVCLFLATSICFSNFSHSKTSDIASIQKNRSLKKNKFLKFTDHIANCGKELLDISHKAGQITKGFTSKMDSYRSVQTRQQFNELQAHKEQTISHVDVLKKNIKYIKNRCPLLNESISLEKTDTMKKKLNSRLSVLQGVEDHIDYMRDYNTELYDKGKLFLCWINLGSNKKHIGLVNLTFNVSFDIGDIHFIKTKLNTLNMLYDYASTYIKLCDVDNSLKKALAMDISHDEERRVLLSASSLKSILDYGQTILAKAQKRYEDHFDFQTMANLSCSRLEKTKADLGGICEIPLDNPSWAYSAHYFENQTLKH